MLKAEILTGAKMKAAGIDAGGEQVAPDQEVVVTRFAPVKRGSRFGCALGNLHRATELSPRMAASSCFERSLGPPRNWLCCRRGWYLTGAVDSGRRRQTPDGLTRVDFVNGRPESVDVLLKGKKLK